MSKQIFFASDFHFGHANIASPNTSSWKKGFRNFKSIAHMDDVIISNINNMIGVDDELYFHGDFSFGGFANIPTYRARINCRNIHFILGNHDQHIWKYKDLFSSVQPYLERTFMDNNGKKYPFIMCHYAFRVWNGSHKGFYHTYGHSHASLEHSPNGKSIDVGVDNAYKLFGEYRPFTLEEVIKILDKREIAFHDHHSSETNVK